MAFKIKEGLTINTTSVFNDEAVLQVAAPSWQNARTITVDGDATGSVSIDGSANATLTLTITGFDGTGETPVFSGDVTGDLTGDVYASNGTSKILENGTDGTDAVFTGSVTGNADTASAWADARTVTFATGDVTGSFSINGSADVGNVDLTIGAGTVENTMLVNDHFTVATNGTGADFDIQLGDTWNFNEGEGIDITIGTDTITIAGEDASDTNKGIASFNATHFTVAAGAVSANDLTIGTTAFTIGETVTSLADLQSISIDNITIDANTISSTNTDGNIVLDPNGTGNVNVSSTKIINLATPTDDTDAANKAYVDSVAQGLRALPSAEALSASNLAATYDNGTAGVGATLTANANGAFPTIDGVTLSQGDNIIVNGQTNKAHNGSYVLTTVGDAGTPWVLTRCGFCDEADEQAGSFEFITGGTIYENTGWVLTASALPVVMGTTELEWVQFSGAGEYSAGAGLDLNGTEFSIETGGVTNAMLTNDHFTIATDGTGADFDIQLGDTWNFNEGTGIAVTLSADTVTIAGVDATTSTKGIASFADADFTVTSGAVTIKNVNLGTQTTGNYVADVTVTAGTGLSVTGTGEGASVVLAGVDASTTVKGVASFSSDDFAVTNGAVTIKADGVTLGTQTSGDYVASVAAGTSGAQSSSSGLTITGTGEGAAVTVAHYTPATVGSNVTEAANTFVDAVTFDSFGHVTTIATSAIDFNVAANYAFNTIAVAGQNNVVADSNTDTLTFAASTGITITTNDGTDTITILNSDRGSQQNIFKSVEVTDTVGAGSYSETGTVNASTNSDTIKFVGGDGIDLDIDTTNKIVRIASTESANTFATIIDTVTASATEVIDSFAVGTFRTAKYYIQADAGANFQASEVMVIHNDTTVDIIEYAVVEIGTPIGNISAAISGGNVEISFANAIASTANIVIKRLGIAPSV